MIRRILPPTRFTIAFLLTLAALMGSLPSALAQSVGDYRSNGTGNWGTLNTWQRLNALPNTWATPTATQGYPGQYAGTGTVTIQNNQNVTLNVSPANPIGAIEIASGNRNSYITVGATRSAGRNMLTCREHYILLKILASKP